LEPRYLSSVVSSACATVTTPACPAKLTAQTGVKVHFCDPHSPWQRGTCENTNGLVRQHLPAEFDTS
jgi:IS30 family transposase